MANRRKQLRVQSSRPEIILWNKLRNEKIGIKFRRQYSIQSYVIDFFCPEKRIAIEIDGNQHQTASSQKYDQYRDKYLNALDITVIRIQATEIFQNLKGVLDKISSVVSPS